MDRIGLARLANNSGGKGVTLVQIMDISPVDERTRKVAVRSFEVGGPVGVIKKATQTSGKPLTAKGCKLDQKIVTN